MIGWCEVLNSGCHKHPLSVSSHVFQGSIKNLQVCGTWGHGPSMYVVTEVRGGGPGFLQRTCKPCSRIWKNCNASPAIVGWTSPKDFCWKIGQHCSVVLLLYSYHNVSLSHSSFVLHCFNYPRWRQRMLPWWVSWDSKILRTDCLQAESVSNAFIQLPGNC
jgi:hypothetical protein